MKHVIVPTDLSIRSLQPVHDVMSHYPDEPVRITLLHLVDLPTGIGDLLFRTRSVHDRYPVPAAFLEACEVMANRYGSRITALRPLIRHGSTCAFLENLITGLRADAVFIQPGSSEVPYFRQSVLMMPLLQHCRINLVEVTAPIRSMSAATASVGDLLMA